MKAHEHFKKLQEEHQALSDHHSGMADECEKEGFSGMAEKARACSKVHSGLVAHYKTMYSDAANKAAIDELNKGRAALEPTRVSGVTPNAPGVTAVPRAGQRPIEKKNVDPEFADLVKVDSRDGDE